MFRKHTNTSQSNESNEQRAGKQRERERERKRRTATGSEAGRQAGRAEAAAAGMAFRHIFAKFLRTVSFEKYCRPIRLLRPRPRPPRRPFCPLNHLPVTLSVCLSLLSHDREGVEGCKHIHAHGIYGMQVMRLAGLGADESL